MKEENLHCYKKSTTLPGLTEQDFKLHMDYLLICFKNIPSGLLIPIMPISRTYFLQSDVSLLEICL